MRYVTTTVIVGCLAVAFLAGVSFGAGQNRSTVTNLYQASLAGEFTPGREVLVDLVEIPPNASLDRHWHPGEEFHYYLQGEPEIEINGAGVKRPQLGTVGHVPFKALHRAGAGKAGAKILVFRVHTTGQPWRFLEDEKQAPQDAHRH